MTSITLTPEALQAIIAEAIKAAVQDKPTKRVNVQPKAKATPKPRKKAEHAKGITKAQTARYEALWAERLVLRKKLGLNGWNADETSKNKDMKAIVSEMKSLRDAGVNQFLLKPAK